MICGSADLLSHLIGRKIFDNDKRGLMKDERSAERDQRSGNLKDLSTSKNGLFATLSFNLVIIESGVVLYEEDEDGKQRKKD